MKGLEADHHSRCERLCYDHKRCEGLLSVTENGNPCLGIRNHDFCRSACQQIRKGTDKKNGCEVNIKSSIKPPIYRVRTLTCRCNCCGRRVWWFLKKLTIELSYDPAILLLSIYSKGVQTKPCTHIHIAGTIHNSQKVEAAHMSITDEWINKMCYSHTTEYFSNIKRNEVLILLQHRWALETSC